MTKNPVSNFGFTLVELLVVLAIMGLILAAVIANYAGQRLPRNLRIAENELVTNIHRMESNTLSSRSLGANTPAQFYLIKFDMSKPRQYDLQAIYNVSTPPAQLVKLGTVMLPSNIRLSAVTINGTPVSSGCVLLAFKLPFAKVIMNDGCNIPSDPSITSGDDYDKVTSFISNSGGTTSTDVAMVVTLADDGGTISKTVTISGTTGVVTFQ